jgi:hypothetical protein
MLMKSTPGVNLTNILLAAFLYKSVLCSFFLFTVWLCNLWQNIIGTNSACEMSAKLITGFDYNNISHAAFSYILFNNIDCEQVLAEYCQIMA